MKIKYGLAIVHKSKYTNPLDLLNVEQLCWFDDEPDWNRDKLIIEILKGGYKFKYSIKDYVLIRANAEMLKTLNDIEETK